MYKCLQSPDGSPAWAFSFPLAMSDLIKPSSEVARTVREHRIIPANSVRYWSSAADGIDARFARCMDDIPAFKSEARRRAEALFETP